MVYHPNSSFLVFIPDFTVALFLSELKPQNSFLSDLVSMRFSLFQLQTNVTISHPRGYQPICSSNSVPVSSFQILSAYFDSFQIRLTGIVKKNTIVVRHRWCRGKQKSERKLSSVQFDMTRITKYITDTKKSPTLK